MHIRFKFGINIVLCLVSSDWMCLCCVCDMCMCVWGVVATVCALM